MLPNFQMLKNLRPKFYKNTSCKTLKQGNYMPNAVKTNDFSKSK